MGTARDRQIASYEGSADGERFSWRLYRADYGLLLTCGGYLTNGLDAGFQAEIEAAIAGCPDGGMLIDLTGCRTITSTSFGYLIRFYNLTRDLGLVVLAVRPERPVERLLGILGVNELFTFVESRPDGEQRLRSMLV